MAKTKKQLKNTETENTDENVVENEFESPEVELNEENLSEEMLDGDDEMEETTIDINDIPIDQFLKDSSLVNFSDESESEEATYWCKHCSDNTLFIDNVCTVCGQPKEIKKSTKDEDLEEMDNNGFELTPQDEDLGYLNLEDYNSSESYD